MKSSADLKADDRFFRHVASRRSDFAASTHETLEEVSVVKQVEVEVCNKELTHCNSFGRCCRYVTKMYLQRKTEQRLSTIVTCCVPLLLNRTNSCKKWLYGCTSFVINGKRRH